jgi:NAD-dependent dihydropyrimidine dehydrogenase PreA subunit
MEIQDKCTGCGTCLETCPNNVFVIDDKTSMSEVKNPENCVVLDGYSRCRGHIQCDAIIMDNAVVISTPKIGAFCEHAQLVHEAAIGRLESQQLLKLMSLGLSEKEAEDTILKGFLK